MEAAGAIIPWTLTEEFLEAEGEVEGAGEAGLLGDLGDVERGVLQKLTGATQALVLDKGQWGDADLRAEELREAGPGKAGAAGEGSDGHALAGLQAEEVNGFANARILGRARVAGVLAIAQKEGALKGIDGKFLMPPAGGVGCGVHLPELCPDLVADGPSRCRTIMPGANSGQWSQLRQSGRGRK